MVHISTHIEDIISCLEYIVCIRPCTDVCTVAGLSNVRVYFEKLSVSCCIIMK